MLKSRITDIIQKYDIDAGVIVKYGDQIMYQHQAEKIFPAGSLIDLAIAAYIEDQWKKTPEVVDEKMEVTDLSRVRGAGIIGDLRRTNWSVRDLVYLTSALSDNVATNLLIEKFDIYEIDSESEKKLIYDTSKLYEEDNYLIYFKDLNSKELDRLKNYNVDILSYLIGDKRYYARNSQALIKEYTKDMNMENKILYEINGVKINALNVVCTVEELINIERDFKIY